MNKLFIFLSNWLLEHKLSKPPPSLTVVPLEISLMLASYPRQISPYNAFPTYSSIQCRWNRKCQRDRWKAHIDILFSQSRENTNLMVLSLGWQQVILGMPWLCKWNSRIDWLANTISIPRSLASPPPDYIPQ